MRPKGLMAARRLAAVAALATSWLVVPADAASAGKALLVGIDTYQNSQIPTIQGAKQDVAAMQDFIRRHWDIQDADMRVLVDRSATRAGILDALDNFLISQTRPGDLVIIYASSHGVQFPDLDGDELADNPRDPRLRFDEALVPYDAVPGDPRTHILDDEIGQRILRLQGRTVLVITDACYSRTMTRGGDGSRDVQISRRDDQLGLADDHDQVIAWSASTENEKARYATIGGQPRGVFTEAFIRGAEGAADAEQDGRPRDGWVSNQELLTFTRNEARRHYERASPNEPMTPTLEGPPGVLSWGALTLQPSADPAEALMAALPQGQGQVNITIAPANGYVRPGETRAFRVQSDLGGQLLLLDVNLGGRITQLFPNPYMAGTGTASARRIGPGQAIFIPDPRAGLQDHFVIRAGNEPGMVIAIVVADDVPLARVEELLRQTTPAGGLPSPGDPEAYVDALAKVLSQAWTGDAVNRPVRMARAHVRYEVAP